MNNSENSFKRYYGKYRGKVENTMDLNMMGRIQVSCPAVLGKGTLSWAMPSTPFAGAGVGFYSIPPIGTNIWVEFENGDPNYPIWTGCFWNTGECPVSSADAPVPEKYKLFKTDSITLAIDDTSSAGFVKLIVDSPAVTNTLKMIFDSEGVLITDDPVKIRMSKEDIELAVDSTKYTITKDEMKHLLDPSTITVTKDEIKLVCDTPEFAVAKDNINLKNENVESKFTSDKIQFKNSGKSVTITDSKVDINEGSLEVE